MKSGNIKMSGETGATQGCDAETSILLEATPGSDHLMRFGKPSSIIQACVPDEVGPALTSLGEALRSGYHVAGWLSYELGYLFEDRLKALCPQWRDLPLLWFGVYESPKTVRTACLGATRAYAGPLRFDWDVQSYRERFDRVKTLIGAGDIYQANLSFRARFHFVGDPLALYLRLRDHAQAPHGGFVDMGSHQILSLSPELFFAIDTARQVTCRPMKGTAPRGSDPRSDAHLRAALVSSAKDRAENLMIVDLLRNDLGRLAQIGSVQVDDLFAVETYPSLHTMVSTVRARLRPGLQLGDILRALFPCGSVTGAPKIRAMQIIREMEDTQRGVYCGAMGYFAPDGSANFNVAIRTITLSGQEGVLGIGGAVVQDSRSDDEFAECLLKARYFEQSREPIALIETLRFEREFDRLGRHLARMKRSAAAFFLPFDEGKAHAALQNATSGKDGPWRVRLLLDEQGLFACTASPLEPVPALWRYAVSPDRINSKDPLLVHKTSWRQIYDHLVPGVDETIFCNERDELTEGSRTNIFVRLRGRLLTPPLSSGLLDGILRRSMLESEVCHEAILTKHDLMAAEEVFLGNSLRGLIRAIPHQQFPGAS